MAVDTDQAPHGLNYGIESYLGARGAGMPESRYRSIDEGRVVRLELLIA